jgi:hypothetical protein
MSSQLSLNFPTSLAAVCVLGADQPNSSLDDFEKQQRYTTYAFSFYGTEALEDLYDDVLVRERRGTPSEALDKVIGELGLQS